MTLALAASLFAVAVLLSAHAILTRELASNYLKTVPAHVTFETEGMSATVLEKIIADPEVQDAEMRDVLSLQIKNAKGIWYGLRAFVIKDFNQMRVSKVFRDSGSWPPATGEILVERTVPELSRLGAVVRRAAVPGG